LTPEALESIPDADSVKWKMQRSDVREAIKRSGNSSPGPDGIPAAACRALGSLTVDVLFGALAAPGSEFNAESLDQHHPDFNMSLLFLVPRAFSEVYVRSRRGSL